MAEHLPAQRERQSEREVRADHVKLGDYLLGLGRVEGITRHGRRVTLRSAGSLWRVETNNLQPVVILRDSEETPCG